MAKVTIALAGNPNTGKSTVFNTLTGAQQHVGNWPGKTVEKKVGMFQCRGQEIDVVDLPGAYSLSAYSPEEEIARDFIVIERPRVIVNVVDASNLERNLYLTVQILETGIPLIIVLNMSDLNHRRGVTINSAALSERLGGTPVIPMVATQKQGLNGLREAIAVFATKTTCTVDNAIE